MSITAEQLKEYFRQNECFVRTQHKVELLFEAEAISVTLPVEAGRNRGMMINLVAEFRNADEFIDKAGIMNVDDLQHIKNSVCWSQYILGRGYISCMLQELNHVEVCFRLPASEIGSLTSSMTMVYSMDLHYYDEVDKTLTLPEQFIGYIESKKEELTRLKPGKAGFMELMNISE